MKALFKKFFAKNRSKKNPIKDRRKNPFIKNIFLKNPLQKLLALCFAVVIWAFAPSLDKNNLTEVQFFVPVSYINLPKSLGITSEALRSISVSVEVSRDEVSSIHPSLFQAVIDLENAAPGKKQYQISKNILKTPPNIKLVKLSPKFVTLTFEKIIEKNIAIRAKLKGKASKGYILKQVSVIPDSVNIKGLVSKVSKINTVETKIVNIQDISDDQDILTQLNFPKYLSDLETSLDYFTVRLKVGSEPVNIRFDNIPVGIINQTYVTRINPKYFNVLLQGPRSLMRNYSKHDIQAFINLKGYAPGIYKVKIPVLRLPPEIILKKSWPPIDIWIKTQKID